MSTLLLIRHGQAAAYEPDSDRLTELGERQARRLGEHLAQEGIVPERVLSGTLERQVRTRDIVAEGLATAGVRVPEPEQDARWNEYDAPGVLGRLMPSLAAAEPEFAKLVEDFQQHVASADRNRYFQRMFEMLMARWQTGQASDPSVEPFDAFHGRVSRAFSEVTEEGGKRVVLLFTSGGPIGVCVQSTLGAPPRAALALNWRVKNGSITEILFSKGRRSLDGFNAVGHLGPDLRTFR